MKTPLKVHLALLLVALIYGTTYVIAKGVMPDHLGPSAFIFIRVTIAGILFFILSRIVSKERIRDKRDYLDLGIDLVNLRGNHLIRRMGCMWRAVVVDEEKVQ